MVEKRNISLYNQKRKHGRKGGGDPCGFRALCPCWNTGRGRFAEPVSFAVQPSGVTLDQPGVQLLFKPSMELPFTFTSDALRIQQVLTNLLTNACKHTKEGEIRLGCSMEEVPGMIAFSVEDTGPGIPEGEAQRIFERFVKLDDFVQGTGLGLSICREIAAKMNGKIYLDTSYGPGARFVFAVPV